MEKSNFHILDENDFDIYLVLGLFGFSLLSIIKNSWSFKL